MQTQLELRLNELNGEYEEGQKMLAELDSKREQLTHTLIRISGAIQVIKEELEKNSNLPTHESELTGIKQNKQEIRKTA